MRLKQRKPQEAIKIDNRKLKELYTRLVNTTAYGRQLYEVNTNLGSCREPHDYAQETLATLVKKLKAGTVRFTTEGQLWAWCSRVLNWQLMSQHRDYTVCKMRKGKTVDIDGDFESGTHVADVAGSIHADKQIPVDRNADMELLKDYILAYSGPSCEIVKIDQLFNVNTNCTLVSLYKIVESIDTYGTVEGLKRLNIMPWQQTSIIEAIMDFMNVDSGEIAKGKPAERVLGSRERDQIAKVRAESEKRTMFDISKLKRLF